MEDCYYFLYSKCSKGDSCKFRHSYSSKENPVLCKNWDQKKKCSSSCPFRHSDYHLKKSRSGVMCYWESTTGCRKDFCEFKHKDPKKDEWKSTRVKTLEEIKIQKERIRRELLNSTKSCASGESMDKAVDDRYLEEIDREIDEIDELLEE